MEQEPLLGESAVGAAGNGSGPGAHETGAAAKETNGAADGGVDAEPVSGSGPAEITGGTGPENPPVIYQAVEFSPDDPQAAVGTGLSTPVLVELQGIGKIDRDPALSCDVPVEYLCMRLALLLGLPVPTGAVVATSDGAATPGYVSLRFGRLNEMPAPVIPTQLRADHPAILGGVGVFDSWILNKDRHHRNLAYRRGSQPPVMFDHGHAFGGPGRGRFKQLNGHLADTMRPSLTAQTVLEWIEDSATVDPWIDRICSINYDLVRLIGAELIERSLLSEEELDLIINFLRVRATKVRDLRQTIFRHVSNWGLA